MTPLGTIMASNLDADFIFDLVGRHKKDDHSQLPRDLPLLVFLLGTVHLFPLFYDLLTFIPTS